MLRGTFLRLYDAAFAMNHRNILDLVSDRPYPVMCDLGCDDGEWTTEVARSSRSHAVFGIEIVAQRARIAHERGVSVTVADLNRTLPFRDESFDLVHANQVIEHVSNLDTFLSEINRVLRVGGMAVISTENGSSWHNIFAATMGWQIFSLTNVSGVTGSVGNPLALHRGDPNELISWTHKTVFNYRGLKEMVDVHGLTPVRTTGAGYHPMPAGVGRLDVRHSHFITVKAVKAPSADSS